MQLYGLKNCDTCRKALQALSSVEFVDVRKDGVPLALLSRAHAEFGVSVLNTRSTTWRGLSDADKEKDPLELLQAHPTLMKRPLIVDGDNLFLGWTKDVQTALGAA